jgi:arylsulfatase A-like enzyme
MPAPRPSPGRCLRCSSDALLLVALIGLVAACRERSPSPRLVVLVVVDTLRADHLSQYGYERETSRALDRFASHATLFASCYAPASWTTPSTASILTGLLPARHGADARGAALDQEALTLAEALRSAAWETAGISFNHNVCVATQFDQGFERFRDHRGDGKEYPDVSELLDLASDWVQGSRGEQLFLYLQPMNVHGPYRVPKAREADLLGSRPGRSFRYSKGRMDRIMKEGRLDERAGVDAEYLASHRDQYDVAVRYTMDELGRWLAWLERERLYDEALIVVTADHGEELY